MLDHRQVLQLRLCSRMLLFCCVAISFPAVLRAQSPGVQRPAYAAVSPAVSRSVGSGSAESAIRPSLHTVRTAAAAQQDGASAQSATDVVAAAAADQRAIDSGRTLFQKRCVQCHDAEKSLQKSRTAAEWRSTVARMARQDGA